MSELRFHLDGLRDASGRIGRVFNRLDGSGDDTRHSGRIIDGYEQAFSAGSAEVRG
jgi:hypothetical protein